MGLKLHRLRTKFYLSFGAVLMLGTLVAALMVVMMLKSSSSYKEVLETDRRVAELALNIESNKLKVSESLRGRLLHPYGDFGTQELSHLSQAFDDLGSAYATTRQLAKDPQLISTLDEIERIDQQQLGKLERQILDSIERQESAEAERLYFDEYIPARAEQQQLLDQLNKLASSRITTAVQVTRSESSLVAIIAVSLTLMLIVVGCVLSYYLTRSFENPINKLMATARSIAAGDLDQNLRLERKDELGEMAEVLNQMVSNLRHLNANLGNQVRWLREAKDDLSRAQGQLVQSEKMAALGQLVAGVAHELNNPISFVYSNSMLLNESIAHLLKLLDHFDSHQDLPQTVKQSAIDIKREIDYDFLVKDICQAIEDCHEGSRRVRDIVLNLRTFSRIDDSELQSADVIEGIESTIRILAQYFRPDRVVVHRDFSELPKIDCYPGQLSQVWMNLMVNAAQAMNSKGDLWITARREGDNVVIKFRDAGPGIPSETLNKIFDPFFTTKAVGEGTGLGLSIVHGIIERHNGQITVESEMGVGTTFSVVLPIAKASAGVGDAEPSEAVA
ncbi:MAG TPA: ATP-binding protein [Blastocatellia bacterium]|nr:ATP-binding protein [Blastocatellia bacterium]